MSVVKSTQAQTSVDKQRWYLIQEEEDAKKAPVKSGAAAAVAKPSEDKKQSPIMLRLPQLKSDHDKVRALVQLHARSRQLGDASMMSTVRGVARTAFGDRIVRTRSVQQIATATVAANTQMAVSIPADLSLCADFSDLRNLFDECRVREVRCEVFVGMLSNVTTVCLAGNALFGMSYDPTDSTAPASLNETVLAAKHTPLYPAWQNSGFGFAGANFCSSLLAAMHKDNWLKLSSGRLMTSQLPTNSGGTTSASPIGGDWVATTASALVACWFKLYGEDPQTNDLSWYYRPFLYYDVEFRSRG